MAKTEPLVTRDEVKVLQRQVASQAELANSALAVTTTSRMMAGKSRRQEIMFKSMRLMTRLQKEGKNCCCTTALMNLNVPLQPDLLHLESKRMKNRVISSKRL